MSSTHVLWCTYTYIHAQVCVPPTYIHIWYTCVEVEAEVCGPFLWTNLWEYLLTYIFKRLSLSQSLPCNHSQSVWVLRSVFCSFMINGRQFVEIYFRCNIQKWVANHKEGRILFWWTSSCNRKSQWGPKNAKPHLTQFSTHFPPTHAFFLQMTCWSTALLSTTPGHSLVHCQASCLMTLLMHCENSPFLWLLQCEHILAY